MREIIHARRILKDVFLKQWRWENNVQMFLGDVVDS
jgi:hypothetical protein